MKETTTKMSEGDVKQQLGLGDGISPGKITSNAGLCYTSWLTGT